MESSKKIKVTFDGKTDVNNFLTKVELESSLKDYADEKKANFLASRLVGPAFDVYMRLSDEKKKVFDEIKAELKKEFERGQLNREEALSVLQNRSRGPEESPQTFEYKLKELVQLAYPDFADDVRKKIAKDYYMKGVHPEMQIALKSRTTFATDDISTLATETVRLALAGVKSYSKCTTTSEGCDSVDAVHATTPMQLPGASSDVINAIADVVVTKLKESSLAGPTANGANGDSSGQNFDGVQNVGGRGNGFGGRRGRGRGRGSRGNSNQIRKCRSCQSTDHVIKNCPTKFCEACGQRGHSQYDRSCPNYS